MFHRWRLQSLPWSLLVYLGLSTVAAVLAYHLIEAPMVALGQRLTRRTPAPAGAAAVPFPWADAGERELPLGVAAMEPAEVWQMLHRH